MHPQSVMLQYPVVSVALFPAVHVPVVVTKYPFPHTVNIVPLEHATPSVHPVMSYGAQVPVVEVVLVPVWYPFPTHWLSVPFAELPSAQFMSP